MVKKPEVDLEKEVVEEEPEEPVEVDDVVVVADVPDVVEEPAVVGEDGAAAAVRKAIGPKEPPPFKWKLLGESCGLIVTLFKAVEREDVESQSERLAKEGYYIKLRIVDINEKIEQPKGAKREPVKPESAKKAAKASPEKKPPAVPARSTGIKVPARAASAIKEPPKKPAAKSSPSSAKKKPAPAKAAAKASAGKKGK